METDISIDTPNTKKSRNLNNRNTLTFAEVWDEIFERVISKDKLYAECRAGRIPHLKIGSKLLFRRATIESWIQEQELVNFKVRQLHNTN